MNPEQRAEFDRALEQPDKFDQPTEPKAKAVAANGKVPPPWFKQGATGVQSSLLAAQQLGVR